MLRVTTLDRYFAVRSTIWIAGLFGIAASLIFLFDGLELVRRTSDSENFSIPLVIAIALLRLPLLAEQVVPFAILFGAIGALVGLSRRLELVVTRAAGVSAWQFLRPIAVVSLVLGIAATTLYNPFATWSKAQSDLMSARIFGNSQSLLNQTSQDAWLRQSSERGDTIMHAKTAIDGGRRLFNVTVFVFDDLMSFENRIEARQATYTSGVWSLTGATVYTVDAPPRKVDIIDIQTGLSADQIRQIVAQADAISFWSLPEIIEIARQTGQPTNRFELQYQVLLARPVLLIAMVLIAATVSLRYSRIGQVRELVVGGVAAGFLLYVVAQVTEDFGSAGQVSPMIAAWSPPIFALLMGVSVLLQTEDG